MGSKIVLFDWNGTLLDDTPMWYEAVKATFRAHGKEPPTLNEYVRGFMGDYLKLYRSRGIEASREDLNAVYESYYQAHMHEVPLAKNARHVLKKLVDDGIFLGLITAQRQHLVLPLLQKFNLVDMFNFRGYEALNKKEIIKTVCGN